MIAVDGECAIIQTEADQVRVEKNYSTRLLWGRTTPKGVNTVQAEMEVYRQYGIVAHFTVFPPGL